MPEVPPLDTVIAILQPTSPFRTPATVRECVRLVRSGKWNAACTVTEASAFGGRLKADEHGTRFMRYAPAGWRPRTQDVPRRWAGTENGCVYAFTRGHLKSKRHRLCDERTAAVVIDRWEALDIDSPADLEMARMYWKVREMGVAA